MIDMDQVEFISRMKGWLTTQKKKSSKCNLPPNRIKDKNHIIISIGAKKAFDKN